MESKKSQDIEPVKYIDNERVNSLFEIYKSLESHKY